MYLYTSDQDKGFYILKFKIRSMFRFKEKLPALESMRFSKETI